MVGVGVPGAGLDGVDAVRVGREIEIELDALGSGPHARGAAPVARCGGRERRLGIGLHERHVAVEEVQLRIEERAVGVRDERVRRRAGDLDAGVRGLRVGGAVAYGAEERCVRNGATKATLHVGGRRVGASRVGRVGRVGPGEEVAGVTRRDVNRRVTDELIGADGTGARGCDRGVCAGDGVGADAGGQEAQHEEEGRKRVPPQRRISVARRRTRHAHPLSCPRSPMDQPG